MKNRKFYNLYLLFSALFCIFIFVYCFGIMFRWYPWFAYPFLLFLILFFILAGIDEGENDFFRFLNQYKKKDSLSSEINKRSSSYSDFSNSIPYLTGFDFKEHADSIFSQINDDSNLTSLNTILIDLKSFIFYVLKNMNYQKNSEINQYKNTLIDDKNYINLGLLYYYFYRYEIDKDDFLHDKSNNFKEAVSNFYRASKDGSLLGRDFLEEMYDRVKTFDISLSKDFENEIRIELGLHPKS